MPFIITLEQAKSEYEHWKSVLDNEQIEKNPDQDIIEHAIYMMDWMQEIINRFA
jgi:hypothetical protein